MSRTEWILGGLSVVLLMALGVGLLLFRGRTGQQDSLGAALAGTARDSYRSARPAAQLWAEDAELVTAQASWSRGTSFLPSDAGWSFVFYSRSRAATALVSVAAGEAVLVTSQETVRNLEPVDEGDWMIDSAETVAIVLASGGEAFMREEGEATLALTLSMLDSPSWQATLSGAASGRSLVVRLDASSADLVDVVQSE